MAYPDFLEAQGYVVLAASDAAAALRKSRSFAPHARSSDGTPAWLQNTRKCRICRTRRWRAAPLSLLLLSSSECPGICPGAPAKCALASLRPSSLVRYLAKSVYRSRQMRAAVKDLLGAHFSPTRRSRGGFKKSLRDPVMLVASQCRPCLRRRSRSAPCVPPPSHLDSSSALGAAVALFYWQGAEVSGRRDQVGTEMT